MLDTAQQRPPGPPGRFSVQEYRKPEYEVTATPILNPARPYAVQGEDFEVRVESQAASAAPPKRTMSAGVGGP